jgi:hypothetical protein
MEKGKRKMLCSTEQGERLIKGCEEHINDPDVRRKGNSTAERGFVSDMIKYKAYAKEHYRQKGHFQFTPGEVRACRNYLLSQNNPVCFMLYVIMLMGIKLFLRIQEVLEMKVEHLNYVIFYLTTTALYREYA